MPPQPAADLPDDSLERWASIAGASQIGHGSQLPLHAQIQQLLLDLIDRGELKPGERLPAERDLAELFSVSLAPVRQAILGVVADGFLTRRRGLGTFVRERALDEKISILHSMTETMREQHVEIETQVLRQEIVPTSARVAGSLQVSDSHVLLLERLAVVEREPVALMRAYLSLTQFPGLDAAELFNRSLYETLQERYGVVVVRAESVIEVERCVSKDALKLGVMVGEPLLRLEGTAFAEEDRPVERFRVLYRGDRVRFHLDSRRATDRMLRLVPGEGDAA
jgi:GntR family transcriptional regulator